MRRLTQNADLPFLVQAPQSRLLPHFVRWEESEGPSKFLEITEEAVSVRLKSKMAPHPGLPLMVDQLHYSSE